jgi:hypothetical protein
MTARVGLFIRQATDAKEAPEIVDGGDRAMPTADPNPDEQRQRFQDMLIAAEAEGEVWGFANVAEVAAELDRAIAEISPNRG